MNESTTTLPDPTTQATPAGDRPRRIVVIGAVAAGTSAAAKARRNDETAEIVIYEKDEHISYSGCGLPYYIGGEVASLSALTPRDPAFFQSKYRVDVMIRHEVLAIDVGRKTLRVRDLAAAREFDDRYDTLVIATGASAVLLPIPGASLPHVFTLRTPSDARAIRDYIDARRPQRAVVLGSGFIGLEMVENLARIGVQVTLVEKLPQVCPFLDPDMAPYLHDHLVDKGVIVQTGRSARAIGSDTVSLDNGDEIPAELVIMAVGIRPNTALARAAGAALGATGAIAVNARMETSVPDIYACGDCAESFSIVDGSPLYRPLGSTANKMGRIAGDAMTGGPLTHRGIAGTAIFRVFELTVAATGLNERSARERGFDVVAIHNIKPDKPEYYGGREMVIKALADRRTDRLLGVQIVGFGGVDKRIDVFVTAMTAGLSASDLFHLDLAYAPPYATTKDPVVYTGMILDNAIHRGREILTAEELSQFAPGEVQIVDARIPKQYGEGHIEAAINLPQEALRDHLGELDRDRPVVTYCNKGVTGNAAQNVLINRGFKRVYNLSGGFKQYKATKGRAPGSAGHVTETDAEAKATAEAGSHAEAYGDHDRGETA